MTKPHRVCLRGTCVDFKLFRKQVLASRSAALRSSLTERASLSIIPIPPHSDLQLQAKKAWQVASSAKAQQIDMEASLPSAAAEAGKTRDAHLPLLSNVKIPKPAKAKAKPTAGQKARSGEVGPLVQGSGGDVLATGPLPE